MNQLELTGKKQYDFFITKYNSAANQESDLTEKAVVTFLEGMKNSTKNFSLNTLHLAKCAFKYSLKKMFLDDFLKFEKFDRALEMFNVKVQKMKVRVEDLITESEMLILEKNLPLKKFLICLFLFVTGVRASEMCSIRPSDCIVRDNEVEIKINGKGRRKRYIIIPKELYFTILNKFNSVNFLFETKNKTKFRSDSLGKYVSRFAKNILGRRVYPHLFRHSFITNQIKKNVTATALAEYVGNSPHMIYTVYCHDKADPKLILSNIDLLGKLSRVAA